MNNPFGNAIRHRGCRIDYVVQLLLEFGLMRIDQESYSNYQHQLEETRTFGLATTSSVVVVEVDFKLIES